MSKGIDTYLIEIATSLTDDVTESTDASTLGNFIATSDPTHYVGPAYNGAAQYFFTNSPVNPLVHLQINPYSRGVTSGISSRPTINSFSSQATSIDLSVYNDASITLLNAELRGRQNLFQGLYKAILNRAHQTPYDFTKASTVFAANNGAFTNSTRENQIPDWTEGGLQQLYLPIYSFFPMLTNPSSKLTIWDYTMNGSPFFFTQDTVQMNQLRVSAGEGVKPAVTKACCYAYHLLKLMRLLSNVYESLAENANSTSASIGPYNANFATLQKMRSAAQESVSYALFMDPHAQGRWLCDNRLVNAPGVNAYSDHWYPLLFMAGNSPFLASAQIIPATNGGINALKNFPGGSSTFTGDPQTIYACARGGSFIQGRSESICPAYGNWTGPTGGEPYDSVSPQAQSELPSTNIPLPHTVLMPLTTRPNSYNQSVLSMFGLPTIGFWPIEDAVSTDDMTGDSGVPRTVIPVKFNNSLYRSSAIQIMQGLPSLYKNNNWIVSPPQRAFARKIPTSCFSYPHLTQERVPNLINVMKRTPTFLQIVMNQDDNTNQHYGSSIQEYYYVWPLGKLNYSPFPLYNYEGLHKMYIVLPGLVEETVQNGADIGILGGVTVDFSDDGQNYYVNYTSNNGETIASNGFATASLFLQRVKTAATGYDIPFFGVTDNFEPYPCEHLAVFSFRFRLLGFK
jgi:hypothetical protein